MPRQYSLKEKVDALNAIDDCDGNVRLTAKNLEIPYETLKSWRGQSGDLRKQYRKKLFGQFEALKVELHVQMLARGLKIVEAMSAETIQNAPLSQLGTALNTLVNYALKLEEAIVEDDEQEDNEKVIRIEYLYNGELHRTPPWAENGDEQPNAVQDYRVWEKMGKNRVGQDPSDREGTQQQRAWLVAGADLSDGEPSVAGFEEDGEERVWYHD